MSLEPNKTPFNVYAKVSTALAPTILDRNGSSVAEFLLQKYVCKEGLFNCCFDDIPSPGNITGQSDLASKAGKTKGTTIKRTAGCKSTKEAKTERQVKEDKRKKTVAVKNQRVDCLSSEQNACQAFVKPDCSKPKVVKSQ